MPTVFHHFLSETKQHFFGYYLLKKINAPVLNNSNGFIVQNCYFSQHLKKLPDVFKQKIRSLKIYMMLCLNQGKARG